MIIECLVKAHQELGGNLTNFPYLDKLAKYAEDKGVSNEDGYAIALGFAHDREMSASQRMQYRFGFFSGKKKDLMDLFGVNTLPALVKVMKDFNCLDEGTTPARTNTGCNSEMEQIARLLAFYFMENDEIALRTVSGGFIPFREYFKQYNYPHRKKDMERQLEDEDFLARVMQALPQFVKGKGSPVISKGYLYCKHDFSDQEIVTIVTAAIKQAFIRVFDVPEKIYYFIRDNAITYQRDSGKVYLQMLDYANVLGTNVATMMELAGFTHVNLLNYFEDTGAIYYMHDVENFAVFSMNSDTDKKSSMMNVEQISELYRLDALKTLNWDERGKAFVYLNGQVYLNEIFPEYAAKGW